jgi:hypothetical protein
LIYHTLLPELFASTPGDLPYPWLPMKEEKGRVEMA